MNKPDWDTYFMAQCFLVSMRSADTTKHGAIIVDDTNRILSCGYNGPVDGMNDSIIPMTRPHKYAFMIHAEENAILSLNSPVPTGSKIYVTGRPCSKCTRMILRKGIKHIYYGPQESNCVDNDDIEASNLMISQKGAYLIKVNKTPEMLGIVEETLNRLKGFR